MGDSTKIIDPDNAIGTEYTSFSTWESWADGQGSSGDTNTAQCRSSSGTAITGNPVIESWVSGVICKIEAIDGQQALKTEYDTSRFRISGGIRSNLSTSPQFIGIQFDASSDYCVRNYNTVPIIFNKCRFSTTSSATVTYNAGSHTFRNCIATGSGASGIIVYGSQYTNTIQNCILYGFNYAISADSGATVIITNTATFNNTHDFVSGVTITTCASDDGDGSSIGPSDGDWDNEFVDTSAGDFTLLNTGDLYGAGTDLSATFTDDIDGDTRSSWDIGADEYAATGGSTLLPNKCNILNNEIILGDYL